MQIMMSLTWEKELACHFTDPQKKLVRWGKGSQQGGDTSRLGRVLPFPKPDRIQQNLQTSTTDSEWFLEDHASW